MRTRDTTKLGVTMADQELQCLAEEDIVSIFRNAASDHGRATVAGHPERANAAAQSLTAAYLELRRRGVRAQRMLLPLLHDADASVCVWAGMHALEFEPVVAEQALQSAAEGDSIVAFDAHITLREWRNGTLRLPS